MNERTHLDSNRASRGFTVMELIVSIAVIAVLISVIILGVQVVKRRAGALLDASGVDQVYAGVKQFKQEVGFLPPMVKEIGLGANYEQAVVRQAPTDLDFSTVIVVVPPVGTDPARNRIEVYTRASDAEFFKGNGPSYTPPIPANFLRDNRFSQLTLGYYAAGQLEYAFNASLTDVPIDGVVGAGMYKPEKRGFFDVPESMRKPDPADRKRQGKTFGPYVEASGKSVKVETDTTTDPAGRDVTVRDRNGVPLRYYYWIPKSNPPANTDPDVFMEIPRIIGRVPDGAAGDPIVPDERNPKTNQLLRTATWAIVAAGPDKCFGDEPIDYIAQTLGKSPVSGNAENQKLRLLAAKDNIVRLGTED